VDEGPVVYSDLTQLDGEPTNRATPCIERTPVGFNVGEASAIYVAVGLAAMAAACAAGIGIWLGAAAPLTVICSALVSALVFVVGVFHPRRP
jgi:hypothetical protein